MNESEIPPPLPPDPKVPKIEPDTVPVPDAAQIVIEALAPKLDAILTEIGLIKRHVGHLDTEIVELRASRITSDAKINAIDTGVSAIFRMVGEIGAKAEYIRAAQRDTTDAVIEHTKALGEILSEMTDRHDHVMARVVAIEDWKKEHTGEADGSLVSAAAAFKGGE